MTAAKTTPGAASRAKIIAAAAELVKERGVQGATIAAVCRRSGLPVSSVYWFFADKDALLSDVVRSGYDEWIVSVPAWDPPQRETSPRDALGGILSQSTPTLVETPDFLRVGIQLLLDIREEESRARRTFREVRAEVRDMIVAWGRATLGPQAPEDLAEEIATMVIAATDGMLVGAQIYPDWDGAEYVELLLGVVDGLIAARLSQAGTVR